MVRAACQHYSSVFFLNGGHSRRSVSRASDASNTGLYRRVVFSGKMRRLTVCLRTDSWACVVRGGVTLWRCFSVFVMSVLKGVFVGKCLGLWLVVRLKTVRTLFLSPETAPVEETLWLLLFLSVIYLFTASCVALFPVCVEGHDADTTIWHTAAE